MFDVEKKQNKNNILGDVCSGLIFHLPFAVLFGIFTSNVDHHTVGCENTELMKWSKGLYILHTIAFIMSLLLLPLITCIALNSSNATTVKTSLYFSNALRGAIGLILFIAFIGLCVAYEKNEACGDLRTLALVDIIITSVLLGLVALVMVCCCMCLCCIPLIAGKDSFSLGKSSNTMKSYGLREDNNV